VVGLAEVMKSFHEIKSTVSGSELKFLVEDGDAIMPGQVIAEVE
jgi:acetyl-CoA carboxylase biotin carboxyl carrier protein